MKLRAIPQIPAGILPALARVLLALKENIELLGREPAEALPDEPWPAFFVSSYSYSAESAITTTRLIGYTSANNSLITNSGEHFNPANGRFTAPVDGLYSFSANYTRSGGNAILQLSKNGVIVTTHQSLSYGVDWQTVALSYVLALKAGDYVTAEYGPTNSTTVASYGSLFSGHLVAKA